MQPLENQPAAGAAPSSEKLASTTPSATVTTTPSANPSKPLPRAAYWGALIVAAALPLVLLVTLILVLVSTNYNFLEWME